MSVEVLEQMHNLDQQRQDIFALHQAAVRVVDSTRGGLGTFRVDGLSDTTAPLLSDYVGRFAGQFIPHLAIDDDGRPFTCGGSRVEAWHTKFHPTGNVVVDKETGTTRRFYKWDRELWDPEYIPEVPEQGKPRSYKAMIRAGLAVVAAADVVGIGMMAKGIRQSAHAVTPETVEAADRLINIGMSTMLGMSLTSTAVMTGVLIANVVKTDRQQRKITE